MNSRSAHLLIRLYPRRWRERYGAEFATLLESTPANLRTSLNIIASALSERIFPTQQSQGPAMNQTHPSFAAMTKNPSAYLPLAMSLTALVMLAGAALLGNAKPESDEGAIAHLWQLLICGQVPVVAFFAIKWLPRATKQSLQVLALQAGAVLANFALVFFLGVG